MTQELTIAWTLGYVCGFLLGVTRHSRPRHARNIDWRRRVNHDNTPLRARDPATPRPRYWRNVYQPRAQGGPTNPPPRNP